MCDPSFSLKITCHGKWRNHHVTERKQALQLGRLTNQLNMSFCSFASLYSSKWFTSGCSIVYYDNRNTLVITKNFLRNIASIIQDCAILTESMFIAKHILLQYTFTTLLVCYCTCFFLQIPTLFTSKKVIKVMESSRNHLLSGFFFSKLSVDNSKSSLHFFEPLFHRRHVTVILFVSVSRVWS